MRKHSKAGRRKLMAAVEVRWVDTVASDYGWQPPAHYIEKATNVMRRMVTVGLLVRETKSMVMVAHSGMVGNGNIDRVMSIPKRQVVTIRRLR